jgi:outer membrane immunogenic protein
MKLRSGILGLTLTSVVALASANAADMYRAPDAVGSYKDVYAPVNTWTGFYAGVNGGYAFDAQARHGGILDDGGFGGAQLGYNRQGGFGLGSHLVLGIEADIQGAGIDNSANSQITFFTGAVHPDQHNISIDYFGTVRGRIGYAWEQTLFYFTGGFAYGNVNNSFHDLTTGLSYKTDHVQTGYVLGGGVEYKLNPAWSLKAEYQYIDLSHDNATDGLGGYIVTKDTELHTVRGGINYHLGTAFEALK